VNLGDSQYYGTPLAPPLCIRRTYNGQKRVVVVLMPQESVPLPAGFTMRVALYQQGAQYYGTPVIFNP
jgi:hypothetical protein